MMQILELSDTDINIVIIVKIGDKMDNFSQKTGCTKKKKQLETLDLKNIITENKNSVNGVKSTVD